MLRDRVRVIVAPTMTVEKYLQAAVKHCDERDYVVIACYLH